MLLQAGSITALYENGFFRYVSHGSKEVLRMIYFAHRDQNWNTISAVIKNETIHAGYHHFDISYDCYQQENGIDLFHWQVAICGYDDGKITFEINGRAISGFLKNRLGFCILHPLDSASQPAEITHPDGTSIKTNFPEYIAVDNPFKEIRTMRWLNNGNWFKIDFEGDIFETEDQRNWGDASFKTFCTPLAMPFPVAVNKDDTTRQRIVFYPEMDLSFLATSQNEKIRVTVQDNTFNLPAIGIGASAEIAELSVKSAVLLKQLNLDHYRIVIDPGVKNWTSAFFQENENAKMLNLPLLIALHLDNDFIKEIPALIDQCLKIKANIKALLLLSKDGQVTHQQLIDHSNAIRKQLPGVLIGAGSDFNFTEINRNRFNADNAQFVAYSMHPQEHASDDLSLIENIAAQAETVKSVKEIYGRDLPVFISPITLKRRFNPYATDPAAMVKSNEERADPRQKTSFCALFTLGSIKSTCIGGAACITLFQTIGNQGIISLTDQPFPVYDALKLALNKASMQIRSTISSDPLIIDSLLFGDNTLLLWNYTAKSQAVLLPDNAEIELKAYEIKTVSYGSLKNKSPVWVMPTLQ